MEIVIKCQYCGRLRAWSYRIQNAPDCGCAEEREEFAQQRRDQQRRAWRYEREERRRRRRGL